MGGILWYLRLCCSVSLGVINPLKRERERFTEKQSDRNRETQRFRRTEKQREQESEVKRERE